VDKEVQRAGVTKTLYRKDRIRCFTKCAEVCYAYEQDSRYLCFCKQGSKSKSNILGRARKDSTEALKQRIAGLGDE